MMEYQLAEKLAFGEDLTPSQRKRESSAFARSRFWLPERS